jgi:saccharopine dehydrogenase (NAD+, L-lysine-forming)
VKTVVVGIGAVGSVVADVLANSEEFDKVVLADISIEKARAMEKRISNDKTESVRIDATDAQGMATAFKGADLVINSVIPQFNFHIMDACLMAKANYADMACDIFISKEKVGEIVKEPPMQYQARKYDDAYKKAGIIGMLGMGCDPGAVNIFARMAADRLDRVKQILVRDGDNGYVEGHEFAPLWSPQTLIEEVLMPAMIFKDGHYRKIKPFSGREELDFPGDVGKVPVYNVDHEEQETLPTYIGEVLGKGCEYCDFKLALGDEHVETIRTIGRIGLDSSEKIDVKGVKVAPIDVVTALVPDPASIGDRARGDFCAMTTTTGVKDGKDVGYRIHTSMNHQACWNKYHHSATAYTVGVPMAIGAILFAQGKIGQKGVFPPEMLDPKPFVDMLPRFGMNCVETRL